MDAKKEEVGVINEEINELVEAAKVEESEEADALGDALNAREDDFTIGNIRAELREVEEESEAHRLLTKVRKLVEQRTKFNRAIRDEEKALNDAVEERIEQLTDAEIDQLMYKKWFGNVTQSMTTLIEQPLKDELDILKQLKERYRDTLETIDAESKQLEKAFEAMLQELVVTE